MILSNNAPAQHVFFPAVLCLLQGKIHLENTPFVACDTYMFIQVDKSGATNANYIRFSLLINGLGG